MISWKVGVWDRFYEILYEVNIKKIPFDNDQLYLLAIHDTIHVNEIA